MMHSGEEEVAMGDVVQGHMTTYDVNAGDIFRVLAALAAQSC